MCSTFLCSGAIVCDGATFFCEGLGDFLAFVFCVVLGLDCRRFSNARSAGLAFSTTA